MKKEEAVTKTVSSCELDRHPERIVKAVKNGPVFITKRGRSTHVLLSYEQYLALPKATEDARGTPLDGKRRGCEAELAGAKVSA